MMNAPRTPDRAGRRTAPDARAPARSVARGTAPVALAMLLGACGGGDPAVETSTIEMDPAAAPAPPADDPAAIDPALGADAADLAPPEPAGDALGETVAAAESVADEAAAGAEGAWSSLQANWAESAAEVQAHFGELSEDDVLATGGDRQALVAVIGERYSLAPEEAEQQVADWEATL